MFGVVRVVSDSDVHVFFFSKVISMVLFWDGSISHHSYYFTFFRPKKIELLSPRRNDGQ